MRTDHGQKRIMPGRRAVLKALAGAGTGVMMSLARHNALAAPGQGIKLPFENGGRELVAFPQKRPLILLTSRPPQRETPFSVFNAGVTTPNDAFFVRYHWSGIPLSVDPQTYRLRVSGKVDPLHGRLSRENLRCGTLRLRSAHRAVSKQAAPCGQG
jgi:sulfite dehydrogenase (cytochrome) subunit A